MAFDLKSISSTQSARALFALTYGTSGVGKTTFAADMPNSVFIQTEDGAGSLTLQAFPLAKSYDDVMAAITALCEKHEYKTVVIDSLDHLEPLIWKKVCEDNNVKSIEQLTYGKGYTMALDLWRDLLSGLRHLRDNQGMNVMLIAHTRYASTPIQSSSRSIGTRSSFTPRPARWCRSLAIWCCLPNTR